MAIYSRDDLLSCLIVQRRRPAISGFALMRSGAVTIAVLLSSSRLIQAAYPYTVFFQTVPIVAIAPLLVIWFDFGIKSVAVSAFIASVFPVIANTLTGIAFDRPALRDLFKLYGASHVRRRCSS